MLHYAVVFFVIALIAAFFGFGGIAAGAAGIAKILFVVFLIGALVSFLMSIVAAPRAAIHSNEERKWNPYPVRRQRVK